MVSPCRAGAGEENMQGQSERADRSRGAGSRVEHRDNATVGESKACVKGEEHATYTIIRKPSTMSARVQNLFLPPLPIRIPTHHHSLPWAGDG